MKISEKTQLTIGTVIKRVEAVESETNQKFNVLTLKDFNEALGEHYRGNIDEQILYVDENNVSKLTLVGGNRVVIHLLTQKAVVLPKHCEGYVIPSNFVKAELDEDVYAPYFEWYFNNHPKIQKQIAMNTHGSVISTFTIKHLKDLELELPEFKKQQLIGDIYMLRKRKSALIDEEFQLESKILEQQFISIVGGEIHE